MNKLPIYTEKTTKSILNHLRTAACAVALMATCLTGTARSAMTVRSVESGNMDTSNIHVPSSFETDVNKMMENWYLTRYAVIDRDADKRAGVETTDAQYIERLQKLPTVIEMPFNPIVRSFIKMYVERKKGLVETMLGMSLYYMPIFEEALERNGMPLELKYLPVVESALNPNAVSRAGAAGLWQFMPGTATGEGLEVNSLVDERRDPYRSSEAAAVYLKKLYNTFGDWSLAIAAYNCGPGNVSKAIRRAGGNDTNKKDFWEIYSFLPSETRDYIPAYIAACYAMNYYAEHNISPALARKPIVTDSVHVTQRIHFQQISDVLGIPMEEIRILNPQYRSDIIPGHIKPYSLVLPNMQVGNFIANLDSIVAHDADKYAMRDVVNPTTGSKGNDNRGEYVEEAVTKYHTVRKGETINSIARKYGVSASVIKKANGGKKRLKRGKRLKFTVYERRYIETPAKTEEQTTQTAQTTPSAPDTELNVSTSTDSIAADTTATSANNLVSDALSASTARSEQIKEEAKPAPEKPAQPQQPKYITYTIKAKDTLSKIANAHNVSVDDIKEANNLKNDNIKAGDKIKIPTKSTAKKSKSKKKKSRRRR